MSLRWHFAQKMVTVTFPAMTILHLISLRTLYLRRCPSPPRPVGHGRLLPRCGNGDSFLSRWNLGGAHIRVRRTIVGVKREVPVRGSVKTITTEALRRHNLMLLQSCAVRIIRASDLAVRSDRIYDSLWCCGAAVEMKTANRLPANDADMPRLGGALSALYVAVPCFIFHVAYFICGVAAALLQTFTDMPPVSRVNSRDIREYFALRVLVLRALQHRSSTDGRNTASTGSMSGTEPQVQAVLVAEVLFPGIFGGSPFTDSIESSGGWVGKLTCL